MSIHERIRHVSAIAIHELAISHFVASVLVLTAREAVGKAATRAVRRVAAGELAGCPAAVVHVAQRVDVGLAFAGL